MKILLVSNMYPSKKHPHYGIFVENTEKVLLQLPDVSISKAVLSKHLSKPGKLFGYLFFYLKIVLMGIFGGYDVIYGHFISHLSIPLNIVKLCNRRVKLILNAHGNDVIADSASDDKWVRLSHKIVPLADHIIVPSRYFKDIMCRDFHVPEDRILVYPSGGVNTNVFYPQDRRSLIGKFNLDPSKKYIGYISRIEVDKGWDTFLKMVTELQDRKDIGFVVVGDGAETEAFDALAAELGVANKLIRYPLLSQKDISEIYSILDVFCFPTRRKSESLGLIGLEAMACGCLVVASDAGGPASYMIDGVNGFVFPADSKSILTEKVLCALSLTPEQKNTIKDGMAKTTASFCNQAVDRILLDFFSGI